MENARDANPPESGQPRPKPPSVVGEIPSGIELINYVAECLAIGCDPGDVQKQLVAFGYPAVNAEKIVADTVAWRQKNPAAGQTTVSANPKPGGWNATMVLGVIIFFIGIAITAGTYFLASRSGGGTYIVASGAIIGGVIMFFRGASKAGEEMLSQQRKDH